MIVINVKNCQTLEQLEIAHYEYTSYVDIINEAKIHGYNDQYWQIWNEYINIWANYETLKEHLRIEQIIPVVGENYNGNWEVNFDSQEIYIYPNL